MWSAETMIFRFHKAGGIDSATLKAIKLETTHIKFQIPLALLFLLRNHQIFERTKHLWNRIIGKKQWKLLIIRIIVTVTFCILKHYCYFLCHIWDVSKIFPSVKSVFVVGCRRTFVMGVCEVFEHNALIATFVLYLAIAFYFHLSGNLMVLVTLCTDCQPYH